ncbi:type II CAAX endopeptidase family protein [Paenibacillus sp. FSL R10-2734]|uniref:CPBP family intramembrane glutamic endopeptidase n=1 Tax=Paenibacillus sp. FSL R10-2734 TaxID=2954691 RepID=UPI0030DDB36C
MIKYYENFHFAERKGFFRNVILSMVAAFLFILFAELIIDGAGSLFPDDINDPMWVVGNLLTGILIILFTILGARLLSKRNVVRLGFTKANWLQNYGIGTIVGILMITLVFAVNFVTGAISVTYVFSSTMSLQIFLMLIMFLFQGMSEEVLFRGYLLPELSAQIGKVPGIILSSVIFTVLHGMNPGITFLSLLNLFIFSVLVSIVFYRTGNLWVVGAIHTMWNFFQGVIYGTQVSGNMTQSILMSHPVSHLNIINGGDFGFEGGLGTTVIYLITIAIFVLYPGKKNNK